MTTYYISVIKKTNIPAKLASLNLRIPVNLEILTPFTQATYDSDTGKIAYLFSVPFLEKDTLALNVLHRIIVEECITVSEYPTARIIRTTRHPGALADDQNGYTVGCIAINSQTKVSYTCVDNTTGAAVWSQSSLPTAAAPGDSLTYNSGDNTWLPCPSNAPGVSRDLINHSFIGNNGTAGILFNGSSYQVAANIIFNGTTAYGQTPSTLSFVMSCSSDRGAFNIRVTDVGPNGNSPPALVANINPTTGTTFPAIYSTSTLTNLRATRTIWRIEIIGKGDDKDDHDHGSNASSTLYSLCLS